MRRLHTALLFLGLGALPMVACSEDDEGPLFGDTDGGLEPLGGSGGEGNGGRSGSGGGGGSESGSGGGSGSAGAGGGGSGGGGSAGIGGAAGNGTLPDLDGGPDASPSDAGDAAPACLSDTDCNDGNECVAEACVSGACVYTPLGSGEACGDGVDDECTDPDTCNGQGVCEPNHEGAGTGCGSNIDDACTDPDTCNGQGACLANHEAAQTPCGSGIDDACRNPDTCNGAGVCQLNDVAPGQPCVGGSSTSNECTQPDTCDATGECLANHAPNGIACPDGSCALGLCVEDQPVGCPIDLVTAVPFEGTWSSVGQPDLFDGSCDTQGTPDYALVFTAPQAGTYRFEAEGLDEEEDDPVLTVAPGSCAGDVQELGCDDDILTGTILTPRLDLELLADEVVTVYLNEHASTEGDSGSVSIELLP